MSRNQIAGGAATNNYHDPVKVCNPKEVEMGGCQGSFNNKLFTEVIRFLSEKSKKSVSDYYWSRRNLPADDAQIEKPRSRVLVLKPYRFILMGQLQ
jgi:hypothetical protein